MLSDEFRTFGVWYWTIGLGFVAFMILCWTIVQAKNFFASLRDEWRGSDVRVRRVREPVNQSASSGVPPLIQLLAALATIGAFIVAVLVFMRSP